MTTLTRRYRFPASHRLHSPVLSEAENARLYGKCNNPFGHGHDYVLEVTVSGPVNPTTGLIVPIARLDHFVADVILQRFAYRNINLDVPEFQSLVPTTENVAEVIADLLQRNWHRIADSRAAAPRLDRVHLQETDRNGFELILSAPKVTSSLERNHESVTANV